jgi:multidrug efflux pump subunit AcrA (membrane-fusion protein)
MNPSTLETSDAEPASKPTLTTPSPPSSSTVSSAAPPAMTMPRRLWFNVVIPLLLLAGAAVVFWMLGAVQTPQRPPTDQTRTGRLKALTPVRVERLQTLESTGQPLFLVVDGTVVPYREARVAAEVAGRVIFKADECEAGTYVKRDQLLMRIDPTDYELEVQRLTRFKEQEYQALQELDQEMANTQRLIDVAKKDEVLQEREVNRLTSLPEGFASGNEIDQARRALLAANQQLVTLENQLDLQRKRRIRLEASEQLAATQLRAAEVNLERTEIRAPIEGVIVSEEADLNTFVSRGSGLMTIEDTSKVEVATSLRMDQLYWILNQRGEELDETSRSYNLPETEAIIEYEVTGRAGAVYRWQGRLLSYDGIGLDPATRTVPVRVVVDDPTQFVNEQGNPQKTRGSTPLVRGMFVRVKLLIKPQTPLVVIPSTALQPGNRIFQFIPDESVLDIVVVETTDPLDTSMASDEAASPAAAEADVVEVPFDPERWQAGKVVVRKSVHPVDSLSVDATGKWSVDGSPEASKLWVCEVRDAELSNDSFVVVSPLGTIEQQEFPVRADRDQMERKVWTRQRTDADEPARDDVTAQGEDA